MSESDDLKEKVSSLTQRLDHSVPDVGLTPAENAAAAAELRALSATLFELLPDKSLSPLERLERFARVTDRTPDLEQLKSASQKVAELKSRLHELAPGEDSPFEKLLRLEKMLNEKSGLERASLPAITKLEAIGDPRGRIEPE